MTKKRKLLEKILAGSKNIQFDELVALLEAFGFTLSRIVAAITSLATLMFLKLLTFRIEKEKQYPIKCDSFSV
jgi:hypothetical protein